MRAIDDEHDAEYWDRQIRVGGWLATGITLLGGLKIATAWDPVLRWLAWLFLGAAVLQALLTLLPWARLVRRGGVREVLFAWWVAEVPVLLGFSLVDTVGYALYLPGALLVVTSAAALYPPRWVVGLGALAVAGFLTLQAGPYPPDLSFTVAMALLLAGVAALSSMTAANRWRQDRRRRAAERRVEHLAYTDPLTGLANRARFDERLDRAVADGHGFALFVVDLDDFKPVNDTLGHAAGDEVLTTTAHRLAAHLRPGDTLARLGGDEFVLLAPALDAGGAAALAERLTATAAEPVATSGTRVRCGLSVGFTTVRPGEACAAGAVLHAADTAMYRVKNGRRERHEAVR